MDQVLSTVIGLSCLYVLIGVLSVYPFAVMALAVGDESRRLLGSEAHTIDRVAAAVIGLAGGAMRPFAWSIVLVVRLLRKPRTA
jgi:hypothetical protein